MKKIDNYFCRHYGNENTHLTLTDKAYKAYSGSDPLDIWEREVDIEDEEGYITDITYLYTMTGLFATPGDWMTEDELNQRLEWIGNDLDELDEEEEEINFDAAVELMDDDLREEIHADLAPCTNQEFYNEYCKRHLEKFGEEFKVN